MAAMIELHGNAYRVAEVEQVRVIRRWDGGALVPRGVDIALDLNGPGGLRLALASLANLDELGIRLVQVGPGAFIPLQNVADLDESAGVVMSRDGALYSISGADIATVLEHLENT